MFKILPRCLTGGVLVGVFGFMAFALSASAAIIVKPPVNEFVFTRGETYERNIAIENPSDEATTYYLGVEDFVLSDETGNQNFFAVDPNETGLPSWIRIAETQVTVAPKENREIRYTITVPASASAGSDYAALMVSEQPLKQGEESQVALNAKVASLVLVTVEGDVSLEGKLLDFSVTDRGLLTRPPVHFLTRVENTGTVHFFPVGNIEIKNMFGSVVANVEANPSLYRVLPSTIRQLESAWEAGDARSAGKGGFFSEVVSEWKNFAFGRYEARLTAVYGQNNEKGLDGALVFWVLPWHLMLAFIVLLVILYVGIVRPYNTMIIKKYGQKNTESKENDENKKSA